MVAEILLRVARLGDGVIAFPVAPLGVVCVIRRVVVIVRAFEHLPIVKSLPPFARDKLQAAMAVHMPLADVTRVVARRAQDFPDGNRLRVERHIIHKDTVGERSLPGQQRCPHRRANRHGGDRINEADALPLEPVEVRRLNVRVACVTERLKPPLVSKDKDDIRRASGALPRLGCSRGEDHRHKPRYQSIRKDAPFKGIYIQGQVSSFCVQRARLSLPRCC